VTGTRRGPGDHSGTSPKQTTGEDVDATVQPVTDEPEVLELRHGYYAHYVLDRVARRRRLDALAHTRRRGRG
jgi:hypothetical protein